MEDYKKIALLLGETLISKAPETREEVEKMLPELRESEDERIRKWLIGQLKQGLATAPKDVNPNDAEKAIAWLEKQSNEPKWCHHKVDLSNCSEEYCKAYYDGWNNCNMQHSQCRSELDDVVKCLINGMKFYYEDNKEATWGTDKWSMPVKHIIEVLEKQGEQKPADKVEPKFKVGDWIVFNGLTLYIKEVVKGYYRTISKGGITNSYDWDIDNVARLWTIQDAKDGDVLVDDFGNICIYQEPSTKLMYHSYCYGNHKCFIDSGGSHIIVGTCPATKEQRDTLFKAMADAGYTFDFDKKELKKIEPKFHKGDIIKPKDRGHEPWEIMQVDALDKKYRFKDGYVISFSQEDDYELVEQKPAWSEEDERLFQIVIDILDRQNHLGNISRTDLISCIRKLKSLKDRVQPQPKKEWSEEDEVKINRIVACLENLNVADNDILLKDVDWLKSLRPQSMWKPSEEQIEALEVAVKHCDRSDYRVTHTHTKELLEQLKKLKG